MASKKNRDGPRWWQFVAYARGRAGGYRPTLTDLWALARYLDADV